jgi:hypothetical protein
MPGPRRWSAVACLDSDGQVGGDYSIRCSHIDGAKSVDGLPHAQMAVGVGPMHSASLEKFGCKVSVEVEGAVMNEILEIPAVDLVIVALSGRALERRESVADTSIF